MDETPSLEIQSKKDQPRTGILRFSPTGEPINEGKNKKKRERREMEKTLTRQQRKEVKDRMRREIFKEKRGIL